MAKDYYNSPVEMKIGEKTYQIEFDNKGYIQTEIRLQKGLCKIVDTIVKENNLAYNELLEIFKIGMMKHHTESDIEEVSKILDEDMGVLIQNSYTIQGAFVSQLLLPKIARESAKEKKSNSVKKKTKMKS